jgi:hypothetical protein
MKFIVYPRRVIAPDISSICLATRTRESSSAVADLGGDAVPPLPAPASHR